jgi:TM2 domain-containing membrane protein YozV
MLNYSRQPDLSLLLLLRAVIVAFVMNASSDTHSKVIGYVLWLVGFTGAHRFYYGRQITGIIWLFTGGLFLIGWIVDLFLIPSMNRTADRRYVSGPNDYSVAWLLLAFLGAFGLHRFYLGKWGTGLLYLLTCGLLGIGIIYDFLTLNSQISERNQAAK